MLNFKEKCRSVKMNRANNFKNNSKLTNNFLVCINPKFRL